MTIRSVVFDAYGTLFDVNAAARRAAQEPGFEALAEIWPKLANDWRNKQLQYTWLRTITRDHCDFWQVTKDALDWSIEASGLQNDPRLRDRLLELYRALDTYPEVPEMLAQLKAAGLNTAILSNGSPEMLEAAVTSANIAPFLDAVLSVETVGVFKPSAQVYDLVGETFETRTESVLFASSNGWDAAGATNYGFRTVWVNRAGDPVDRIPGTPAHILTDLSTLPSLLD